MMNEGARGEHITFTVLGRPETQGSVKAFMIAGKPRLTSDNKKMKPWRQQVGWSALEARGGAEMAMRGVPIVLGVTFYLARPKSLPKRELWPTRKPDTDKLVRAILDSLTGVLYEDDSAVVEICARKVYGLPERAEITVEAL